MLHRRAGFGANWQQLQRDLKDGPKQSVERILGGKSREDVADGFEETAKHLLKIAVQSQEISRFECLVDFANVPWPQCFRRTSDIDVAQPFCNEQSNDSELASHVSSKWNLP